MAFNYINYIPNPNIRWDTGTQGNWDTGAQGKWGNWSTGTANYWDPHTGRQYQVPLTFVSRPPTPKPRSEPNDDGKELFTDSDLDGLLTE